MNAAIERVLNQITQEKMTALAAESHEKQVQEKIFTLTHDLDSYAHQILRTYGTPPQNHMPSHTRETAKVPYTMDNGREVTFQLVGTNAHPNLEIEGHFPVVEVLQGEGEHSSVMLSIVLQKALWHDRSEFKEIGQFDAMRVVLQHIEKYYQLQEH